MLPKLSWAVIVRLTPVPAVGVVLDAVRASFEVAPMAGVTVTAALVSVPSVTEMFAAALL